MSKKDELTPLRDRIKSLDREIISLISQRLNVAKEIGQIKLDLNLPIKDYKVEKDVIQRSREAAKKADLYPDLAEDLSRLMIKYSVMAQDEFHHRSRQKAKQDQKKILIVGGLGHMGLWFSEYFDTFGHMVSHWDPSSARSHYPKVKSLEVGAREADVIVVATPISKSAGTIKELVTIKPRGLVFDICSLKSPIIETIESAAASGLRITSVHPMFGPDVRVLAGRNIILCETNDAPLTDEARELFMDTTANLITLPLKQHDELMGYVLGLSHLTNLVFARVLLRSGLPFELLQQVASTTFNSQLQVAAPVTKENQDLYYEIQAENSFTPTLVGILKEELNTYAQAIAQAEPSAFKELMEASRVYLDPSQTTR